MEESLSTRLDEIEQELVRLLSLRSDDLQIFSSRQDQLLQSHYHSLSSALETAQNQLQKLTATTELTEPIRREIRERWIERRNLKRFWVFCEEIQRQGKLKCPVESGSNETESASNAPNVPNTSKAQKDRKDSFSYQTPNANDSNTNLSITSLSNMSDLSLD